MPLPFLSKKKGLNGFLGELESRVMDVLWSVGARSGREVHFEILKKKKVAYTTTLTILGRLADKGFILKDHDPETGRIIFSPSLTRKEFEELAAGQLIQSAFNLSSDLAISAFADAFSRLKGGDVAGLNRLISERKNAKTR